MFQALPDDFYISKRSLAQVIVLVGFFLISVSAVLSQDQSPQNEHVVVFNQAQDLHEKGDLVGAIGLYEKALKIFPAFPEAEYQRGIAFLALGRNAEAERAFRLAVELRPDWSLAKANLASLLVANGSFTEAGSLLSAVLTNEPQNPLALTAMADMSLRTRSSKAVLTELLAKISPLTEKANPTVGLWTSRAALESALGLRTASKTSIANALSIDPNNRNALLQLADIAIEENDIVKAKELISRLDPRKPSDDATRILKAKILAFESKFDEAIKELDAVSVQNTAANDLKARIVAIRSTDPVDLEKQLETDPKNAAALGRLCTLFRKSDPGKAIAYCRRASEAEPANVNHAVGFGAALVQAKQFDAAVSVLMRIVDLVPDNATARANLATALFQLKRYSEAKGQFEWLTLHQPRSAGAYLFLGIIHDELNEYIDAGANYQQYLRLADPVENKLDIEKVNLRMPQLQKQIKAGKGKKK